MGLPMEKRPLLGSHRSEGVTQPQPRPLSPMQSLVKRASRKREKKKGNHTLVQDDDTDEKEQVTKEKTTTAKKLASRMPSWSRRKSEPSMLMKAPLINNDSMLPPSKTEIFLPKTAPNSDTEQEHDCETRYSFTDIYSGNKLNGHDADLNCRVPRKRGGIPLALYPTLPLDRSIMHLDEDEAASMLTDPTYDEPDTNRDDAPSDERPIRAVKITSLESKPSPSDSGCSRPHGCSDSPGSSDDPPTRGCGRPECSVPTRPAGCSNDFIPAARADILSKFTLLCAKLEQCEGEFANVEPPQKASDEKDVLSIPSLYSDGEQLL